jgi:DNA-binding transcriptional ArsR family regulator
MSYEEIFAALSHPLRQQILLALRDEPASVRALTEAAQVSQPVMSQHLKVLRNAGLVSAQAKGMQRLYQIQPEGLHQLRRFLEQHWTDLLAGLDDPEDAP